MVVKIQCVYIYIFDNGLVPVLGFACLFPVFPCCSQARWGWTHLYTPATHSTSSTCTAEKTSSLVHSSPVGFWPSPYDTLAPENRVFGFLSALYLCKLAFASCSAHLHPVAPSFEHQAVVVFIPESQTPVVSSLFKAINRLAPPKQPSSQKSQYQQCCFFKFIYLVVLVVVHEALLVDLFFVLHKMWLNLHFVKQWGNFSPD